MEPAVDEGETRADHKLLHRARHEDLVRAGERCDSRADVHRDAGHVVGRELDLARVKPGTDAEVKVVDAG